MTTMVRRVPRSKTRTAAALAVLSRLSGRDLSAQETLERSVDVIVRALDAGTYLGTATDPDNGLWLGAGLATNLAPAACAAAYERQLLGFGDDRSGGGLCVPLSAGGRAWGRLALTRGEQQAPFSADDQEFLSGAATLAGEALRGAILSEPVGAGPLSAATPPPGPGVVIAAQSGAVLSVTAEAETWLQELTASYRCPSPSPGIRPELLLTPLLMPGQAGRAPERLRLRTLSGTWLIARASPFAGGERTAIVIEPARASEIAPVLVAAYGLTGREIQVAQLIGRGAGTDEIATTLFLSRHTVRDHLKAIFEKVRVGSRGELAYKLFANHDPAALAPAA